MKLQKIILCVAVALTAFGASLGLLEIGSYIRTAFQPIKTEVKTIKPIPVPSVVYAPPVVEYKQPPVYTPPEVSNSDEESCGFSETGDYYIIGENPKGFEDFDYLTVITSEYDEKRGKDIAVKPKGLIQTTKEFKFSWINITGKRISFVTQSKKGLSYQFDGKFVDEVQPTDEETDYPELKGRLTKWRNGKKIAETKVNFGVMCGC